jgi:hypothetical protein
MIEAWFAGTTHRGFDPYDPNSPLWEQDRIIPCLMPSEELHDLARLAGIPIEDLFSIDIPSGASREARIKCVVAQSQLDYIYKNRFGPYGDYSIPFRWRTDRELAYQEIWLFPLPPKPIFVRPGMAGVYLVEAVDCRYYWKRTPFTQDGFFGPSLASIHTQQSDSSGRNWDDDPTGQPAWRYEPQFPMNGIQTDPLDNPFLDETYEKRLSGLSLTPECSAAMYYDIKASLAGAVVQWAGYGTYIYRTIGNDWVALNAFMQNFKNAAAGGIATTSGASIGGAPGAVDGLVQLWQGGNTLAADGGSPERQIHRAPSQVEVLFAAHSTEAQTAYNNTYEGLVLDFPIMKEYGPYLSLLTARQRFSSGTRLRIKEPQVIPVKENTDIRFQPWPTDVFASTPPGTNVFAQGAPNQDDLDDLAIYVRARLTARCEVQFGRVAWAGWLPMPLGAYRATMLRYTVSHVDGEYVPVTITEAREDDWILGPDGLDVTHPRDLVFGQGMVHARRIHHGSLQIDSAPPMCRVFPARITEYQESLGSAQPWRWIYRWEEVEPRADDEPLSIGCGDWGREHAIGRNKFATNLCEEYNRSSAGVGGPIRIAPGVLQSDFPMATIQPKPIDVGVVVMMVEQFPQVNLEATARSDRKPRYWFSMPNAVKIICTPLTGDFDYGTIDSPSALNDDFGTIDAPLLDIDFGTF